MYCTKCGNKLNENMEFCPNCGSAVNKNPYWMPPESSTGNNKRNGMMAASFFLAITNAPILFIIRMLNLKSETRFGWRAYTVNYIPGNIKTIMFIIMGLFAFGSILLAVESKSSNKTKNILIWVINVISIIIGILIIITESK